jgi:hypothetical protein
MKLKMQQARNGEPIVRNYSSQDHQQNNNYAPLPDYNDHIQIKMESPSRKIPSYKHAEVRASNNSLPPRHSMIPQTSKSRAALEEETIFGLVGKGS